MLYVYGCINDNMLFIIVIDYYIFMFFFFYHNLIRKKFEMSFLLYYKLYLRITVQFFDDNIYLTNILIL